jgi:NodT family efflux transporter outer membrane factor (OMF) lipoprotein
MSSPLATLALAAACKVGPDYERPASAAPAAFKEAAGWKVAEPKDELPRGAWWGIFGDSELAALEEQAGVANPNLLVAEAQVRQASALVRATRAGLFPTVSAGVSVTPSQQSSHLSANTFVRSGTFTDYSLPLAVTWEADLWGRIRRAVESNEAAAQASAADVAAVRLSVQGALAQDYFLLRTADAEQRLLDATVQAFAKALELTKSRQASGVASLADVLQAEAQLKATEAQAIDVGIQRAQLEHAIALLIGRAPSALTIGRAVPAAALPAIPLSLPSELLERRPDIAAAERRVAAANAQIGVAKAAYFPRLTLSASLGLLSSTLANWLTWPSRFWSIGPSLSEVLYDGGLRGAQLDEARAAYDAVVASYRETVLAAFRDVEDSLASLQLLEQEARAQNEAVQAAERSLAVTMSQYKAGTVGYLQVLVAQSTALADERSAVAISGRRLVSSVLLLEALGGGWRVGDLSEAP